MEGTNQLRGKCSVPQKKYCILQAYGATVQKVGVIHHANVLFKTLRLHCSEMYECGVIDPECCENTEPDEDTVDDDVASEDDCYTDYF